ncbi:cubilin isoform X3 [Wyeomyia smithii]|uniref:cubilin isoform X3 n=1 Tax=Wyeomyia smithii TaxID=174621 RepID=UPI002467F38F|nr:cubilin isoform X3 [Wyeomyia smithii]
MASEVLFIERTCQRYPSTVQDLPASGSGDSSDPQSITRSSSSSIESYDGTCNQTWSHDRWCHRWEASRSVDGQSSRLRPGRRKRFGSSSSQFFSSVPPHLVVLSKGNLLFYSQWPWPLLVAVRGYLHRRKHRSAMLATRRPGKHKRAAALGPLATTHNQNNNHQCFQTNNTKQIRTFNDNTFDNTNPNVKNSATSARHRSNDGYSRRLPASSPLQQQCKQEEKTTECCHNNQYNKETSVETQEKTGQNEKQPVQVWLALAQQSAVTATTFLLQFLRLLLVSNTTSICQRSKKTFLLATNKRRPSGRSSNASCSTINYSNNNKNNKNNKKCHHNAKNDDERRQRRRRRLQKPQQQHPCGNSAAQIAAGRGVQKIGRLFLSALLIVNMFTFLHGASAELVDISVGVVPSGYTDSRSRISMVQYLEPLARPTKAPKCDQTFVSRAGGPANGTFNAPLLTNPTNHSRQCLYIFLAGPGQRVDVTFTSFNLRGSPPDCVHEYMDVYAEVQSSDPAELINSPFGGRYCGPIPPRRRISLYRAIALSFYTDKNSTTPDIFEGRYAFINESEYEIGQPVIGSPCSYVINFAQKRTGAIISPTYPGAYPKDMSCTYQFIGKPNQRVRIEFRDFDLFFGGPHCPFDYVRVFDGPDNTSAVVGTYCGQQRNLVLYSSEQYLFVHFSTLQRTANTQNRGFKGIFEFSESFVKLDFIRENDGMHIRGSECDQKILSKKESTGFVYSPNYPFPYIPKVVCRYFVYGMQDAQNLERVKLEFSIFEIPKGEHKGDSNCTDGYLKVYLKGQEVADAYDKFDHELCGNELPHAVISDGPRLVMVFSSGELQGRGFKAKYTFETEYKIPGTAAPDGTCSFTYRSTSRKKGEFNSPRYPSNYPSETNCSYVFLATPNEQVTIVFDHFKVKADGANTTYGAYGTSVCFEDWLEMYVLYRDGTDRFLGRYCSLTAPGPVESPRGAVGIRVVLHTDQENVASGFKARYIFETAKSVFGDCGGNYSGEDSGVVTSPNFPANYDAPGKGLASRACNWYITARIGYKILLNFDFFGIEGEPATRGCAAAVMRLWLSPDSDMSPIEMCGEKPAMEHWQYVTQGQTARISFTSADKAIGAQGFRVIWTEVQDSPVGPSSTISLLCESTYHFQCLGSGYCISERLRCNGVKNCGSQDNSDEMHCIIIVPEEDHGALIISCIAAASFLICLLCTLCHRKRKRRHHRQLGLHRNAHYDSTTSATGISLGSSRRHLQGGGSLSGSLHGINNSEPMVIPPAPLPPVSVPPHVCINDTLLDPDDLNDDLFVNSCDRFDDDGECV